MATSFSLTTPNGLIQEGDVIVARIQNRRGYKVNLPQPLASGELGWCIDTRELFIGLDASTSGTSVNISDPSSATTLLDTKIIEFSSKWTLLNGSIAGAVDSDGSEAQEESFMPTYTALDKTEFINGSSLLTDIENNVNIVFRLNAAVNGSVLGGLIPSMARVTTVESVAPSAAKAVVNVSGGNMTLAQPSPEVGGEGLGYMNGDVVFVHNPSGSAASFSVSVSDDGEGRVESFALISGGSGYTDGAGQTVTVSKPDFGARRAKVSSVSISGGQITAATIDPSAMGKGYKTKPFVTVTGGNATTQAKLEAQWNTANGTIDGITVVDGGAGYTSSNIPTVTIREPHSAKLYKFRYDIGLPDASVADIATTTSALNAVTDTAYTGTLIPQSANPKADADIVGSTGYGLAVTVDSGGQALINANSSGQSAALTTILNELSTSADILASTSQNVEVLTEYSSLPTPPPTIIIPDEDLTNGTLAATAANGWTNLLVDDPDNPGSTMPLSFNPANSDVIHMRMSAKDTTNTFLRAGTLTAVVIGGNTDLSYSGTEYKAPSLSASNLYFRANYQSGNAVIQYWHTFPTSLTFKMTSVEWLG